MNDNEKLVDTSKLEKNMVVKNYKELCKLLGEEVKSGCAKKAQIYNWERFFKFAKEEKKKSFHILEIYDEPIRPARTIGRVPIYLGNIEDILLHYLSKQKDYCKSLVKKRWLYELGMCNENYLDEESFDKIRITYPDIPTKRLYLLYEKCSMKLSSIFVSALKSLKNRKLIDYTTEIMIHGNDRFYLASDEEVFEILTIERNILHDVMGYESIRDVFKNHEQEKYYDAVNDYIMDNTDFDWYYRKIKIIYNQNNILEALDENYINEQKKILNQKIIDSIRAKAFEDTVYYGSDYFADSDTFINEMIAYDENKIVFFNQKAPIPQSSAKPKENNDPDFFTAKTDSEEEMAYDFGNDFSNILAEAAFNTEERRKDRVRKLSR